MSAALNHPQSAASGFSALPFSALYGIDDVLLFHFPPSGRQHYLANKKGANKNWQKRSLRALDLIFFPPLPFQLSLSATKRVKVTHIRSLFLSGWRQNGSCYRCAGYIHFGATVTNSTCHSIAQQQRHEPSLFMQHANIICPAP